MNQNQQDGFQQFQAGYNSMGQMGNNNMGGGGMGGGNYNTY